MFVKFCFLNNYRLIAILDEFALIRLANNLSAAIIARLVHPNLVFHYDIFCFCVDSVPDFVSSNPPTGFASDLGILLADIPGISSLMLVEGIPSKAIGSFEFQSKIKILIFIYFFYLDVPIYVVLKYKSRSIVPKQNFNSLSGCGLASPLLPRDGSAEIPQTQQSGQIT